MAWDHLAVNRPHLVYLILGGFTSLFMLCSSFIKERLYIGEATVATICGIIFGPHGANLIDPSTWGNVDQITLEFSRIVLVVQCFAVGVELPKYYMEKHWRSVVFLLLPVMTVGWLFTSLFIWWLVPPLNWIQSLCCAACVTATDPVLASSVVGKGKFAKRVPKHLRDLLSAESGCNDGMAFPFIYLALYIIAYEHNAKEVAFNWIVVTILYECVFGAIFGFAVGYIGRRGIRWAEKNDLVDRESFLVFYFVLALFCAGAGSIIGVDDLLVGFAAGVGFSNDGWFTQKTEESHVSNVIDLLINLAYFVYFGTIIPWDQYNSPELGLTPWRLVIIAILVVLLRRIPIMMLLKPLIPDIHTWREALFAGHFGPIGVGALFVAILARADLETGGTTPLAALPGTDDPEYILIALIWPITTFLVITSIIIHGSSIAVFTLGKHINTLTLTMSFTTANEDGPSWMNRLPRIASQSKSMSKMSDIDMDEKDNIPPGSLPPIGMSGAFLRRQREEDNPSRQGSRSSSLVSKKRRKARKDKHNAGGPISQSAISPLPRLTSENTDLTLTNNESPPNEKRDEDYDEAEGEIGEIQDDPEMHDIIHRDSDEKEERDQHKSDAERHPGHVKVYREGDDLVTENDDGDVVSVRRASEEADEEMEKIESQKEIQELKNIDNSHKHDARRLRKKLGAWRRKDEDSEGGPSDSKKHPEKGGAALAYQFGNTIIVEDEDGEVVKKFELPPQKPTKTNNATGESGEGSNEPHPGITRLGTWRKMSVADGDGIVRQGLNRVGTWTGFTGLANEKSGEASGSAPSGKKSAKAQKVESDSKDDDRIRFTIGGDTGKRLNKEDFFKEIRDLDPKARARVLADSDAPSAMKQLAQQDASDGSPGNSRLFGAKKAHVAHSKNDALNAAVDMAKERGADINSDEERKQNLSPRRGASSNSPRRTNKHGEEKLDPARSRKRAESSSQSEHPSAAAMEPETPAERRRREGALKGIEEGSVQREVIPETARGRASTVDRGSARTEREEARETPAERRRREAALSHQQSSSSGLGPNPDSGSGDASYSGGIETETPAERRRREAALGLSAQSPTSPSGGDAAEDSDDDDTERITPKARLSAKSGSPDTQPPVMQQARSRGIRFAEQPVRRG